MGEIYKITNKITNLSYIGQTIKTSEIRFKQHIKEAQDALNGSRKNFPLFHRMIIKYGADNFYFEILEKCDNKVLDEREKYWIDYYKTYENGYNSTIGGQDIFSERPNTGKKVVQYDMDGNFIQIFDSAYAASEEVKVDASRIREACNLKQKTSGGYQWRWYGKNIEKNIGSVAEKTLVRTKVKQYDLYGNFIRKYNSIKEAAEETGVNYACISRVIRHQQKTSGGFLWTKEDEEPQPTKKEIEKKSLPKTQRSVIVYTKDTHEYITEFDSIKQAAEELSIGYKGIVSVCEKKLKSSGGYYWEYKI